MNLAKLFAALRAARVVLRYEPDGVYPMVCAWCWREDRTLTITGWCDVKFSSGICERHLAELRREVEEVAG